jgi:hypothetical protein
VEGVLFDDQSIASTPCAFKRSIWSFISFSRSGECPTQSVTSPIVREIGIVHDRASRLHKVDSFPSRSGGRFGSPDGRVQRAGEIDPRGLFLRAVVGADAFEEVDEVQLSR